MKSVIEQDIKALEKRIKILKAKRDNQTVKKNKPCSNANRFIEYEESVNGSFEILTEILKLEAEILKLKLKLYPNTKEYKRLNKELRQFLRIYELILTSRRQEV